MRVARALDVTDRDLRYLARQEEAPRIGRPPHGFSVRWAALMAARRELGKQGWTAGWRSVAEAHPAIRVGLLKECVPALKRRHRSRLSRERARHRSTLVVQYPGVLVTEDGFQAAGTRHAATTAEVRRDAATMRYVGGSAGRSTTAEDVLANLEAMRIRDGLPLVYGSDNGPYRSSSVQSYLTNHHIVWFPSRYRWPRDNGAQERSIREVKAEAGDLEDLPREEIAGRLAETTARLNAHRRRPSRGGFTADELTDLMPACDPAVRPRFYAAATAAIAKALAGAEPRQARAAWREAVVRTLEEFGLARRTGGCGAPAPQEPEVLS